ARRHDAADRVQGGDAEVGAASGIGEEFAELFAQQQGVEDQGPEAANVQQDPDRTDEKTAGVKRVFGRPWMWATAASIVLGLYFASSLTPVLDTLKSKLEPKEPPVAETVMLYVETDIANIREKASTNSRIVSRVAYASKVTEVQRKGPWVKVITDGGKKPVGWIHASLLTPRKTPGAGEQEAASAPVKEEEHKATAKPPAPAAAGRAEPGPEGSSPSEPAATSPPPPETASTSAPEPSSRGGAGAMSAATAPADEGGAEAPALPAPEPFASSPEALAIEPASQTRSAAVTAAPTAAPAATRLPLTGVPEIPRVPRQSAALPERQPRVYGEGNSDSRVILRATRDSWIQVHGADNVLLLTRILRAGDSYRVPNRNGLTLMTGNAGALEILVDGEPVPPIGPFGAVRRDVSLDPNRLKTGSAATN
ncbi:MAG: DUF4115 domain-containing protein, partial [Proteobacteria bacterium]|nr:DUF4115 domain-containing protein [Pseudomonadota bacterium]